MGRTYPTALALLCDLCGLTQRDAAAILGIAHDTFNAYACGRRRLPYSVLLELAEMHKRIADTATAAVDAFTSNARPDISTTTLHLELSATEDQARHLGFPSVGAHRASLALMTAELVRKGYTIAIVPCGDRNETPDDAAP